MWCAGCVTADGRFGRATEKGPLEPHVQRKVPGDRDGAINPIDKIKKTDADKEKDPRLEASKTAEAMTVQEVRKMIQEE